MDFMKSDRSTDDWLAYLGNQIRENRIRADMSQQEMARAANVGLATIKNLEGGKGSSLTTLVQVIRALNRAEWLTALAPAVSVSPLQMLKQAKGDHKKPRVARRTTNKE